MQITNELSPRIRFNGTRRAVLEAIVEHHGRHGRVPKLREVADATGLQGPAIAKALQHMRRDQWIAYERHHLQTLLIARPVVDALLAE